MSVLQTLRAGLAEKSITASALLDAALARVTGAAPLNAVITESFAQARAAATSIDAGANASGALAGLPMAHKDVFCTNGVRTTSGSKMLGNFVPPYSATIVQRLDNAGAISLGKTNMDEFAMGSSTEHSAFGACLNPWGSATNKRVPGGSSGGSAALVAARALPFTTASDTGGSIRQPASFCGVTGIKPSYGRVSRYGMIAYASSLDQAGVIAESAADCALVLQQMAGFDALDSTSVDVEVPDYLAAINAGPGKLRIGVPRMDQVGGVQAGVMAAINQSLKLLEAQGHTLVDIDLKFSDIAVAAYYVIAPCEASSNLSRFDGVRYGHRAENCKTLVELYERSRSEGFGPEVQRRILIGSYALSAGYFDAYYLRAQKVRRLIANAYAEAFKQVDVIATPTAPTVAFGIGSTLQDPLAQYLADVFTVGVNLAGLPAISVPCGLSDDLPVGLQLITPGFTEAKLLALAHQYQQHSDFHRLVPPGYSAFPTTAKALLS
jgi:aspartyl-tRNA(Asn)/glutamyl-tRNA(Gln) amidotransferase subunit A